MVWIDLLEYIHSASRAGEVHAFRRSVIDDCIGPSLGVQCIDLFPCVRVHDHHLSRFEEVAGFDSAANKQATMRGVETQSVRQGPASDWPHGDHFTLLEVNHRNPTGGTENDIQLPCTGIKCQPCGIIIVQRYASGISSILGVNDFD